MYCLLAYMYVCDAGIVYLHSRVFPTISRPEMQMFLQAIHEL